MNEAQGWSAPHTGDISIFLIERKKPRMKRWMRKFVGMVSATAAAATIPVVVAPSAHADSANRCNYPEVCFYADPNVQSAIVARFQVVTSSWQYLQYPNTGYAVWNTRNDDVAYVLQSDGKVLCVKPNGGYGSGERVIAVRIDSRSTC
ncbi:hypothetical protein [Streptomyces sp. NPDC021139]|uniref:hypothetical protein n=1 Tax=unclassified Streptomyces TaxID=2593676 RepID=UPI0033EAE030